MQYREREEERGGGGFIDSDRSVARKVFFFFKLKPTTYNMYRGVNLLFEAMCACVCEDQKESLG